MATISIFCFPSWSHTSTPNAHLLDQVKRAERKTFPRNEVFDFETELLKHNVQMTIVAQDAPAQGQTDLVAYSVVTRVHSTALLHELCVLEQHRRRGIGYQLLHLLCPRVSASGCFRMQLWVDEEREAARKLYSKVGFEETQRIDGYYAPRRNGIKMVLLLQ